MAALGAVGVRLDPLLNHNFVIALLDTSSSWALAKSIAIEAITDVAIGGFMECSGLDMSMDVQEYREGGRNDTPLKFANPVKWSNITLKKGMGAGNSLWDWHYGFATGNGKRRDGFVALLNELHLPSHIWYFSRGLPVKYAGPTMNASASAVAVESIEIAHEGIYQVPALGYATAATTFAIERAV